MPGAEPSPPPPTGPLSAVGFDRPLREALRSLRWSEGTCPSCHRVFYTRRPRTSCLDVRLGCGSRYGFIGRRQRPPFRTPTQVRAMLTERLRSRDFVEVDMDEVVRSYGDTFFTIAGVQLFDDALHRGGPVPAGAFLVAPPVVRVRSLAKVGHREGISSSFVNICTEQANATIGDYLRHVDSWRDALLAAGLDEDGLTYIVEPLARARQSLGFRTVNVNYYGFEIGEAIFLAATQPDCPVDTIIDCGFGFERIMWAASEVDSYFAAVGPLDLALAGHARPVDFVRTMVLLAGAGLTPANNGAGHVLRRLGRIAAEEGAAQLPLEALVRHSYDYWSGFTAPLLGQADVNAVVTDEVFRNHNAVVAQRLGLRIGGDRLHRRPDAFLAELLHGTGLTSSRLREALRSQRA